MSAIQLAKPAVIRVVALCLFRHNDRILVFQGFDSEKGTYFYRPLGGGVEPGETTEQAIAREIREEAGVDVTALRLIDVVESIFSVNGRAGHEIVFVYDGRFVDETLYTRSHIEATEGNGEQLHVTWRSLDSFNDQHRLVPEALLTILQ